MLRRCLLPWILFWLAACGGQAMRDETIAGLRHETRHVFYHGFDGYLAHAFPDDELRPLSCAPLTRDRANPAHIEVNDVLGNYSLTLVDSLSTLAIFASSESHHGREPLADFHDGVRSLVELYGDGSPGSAGQGSRARGFDLDSKVQVFETTIRGVGGLLSAHQFAVGDLPIRGYRYLPDEPWPNGFTYDGQLLRLATDLARRLLPAFDTPTGLPYPRVNLRHGIPFYKTSPLTGPEITETCSAGAGSLVLEFSTLSRLTGDPIYERLAKHAFWAVWHRRSSIGLLGAGIDAETGNWVSPYTGIGAGIDSFFEYALKSHILLSGLPHDPANATLDSPDAFLAAWEEAHDGIKRHIYRGAQHHHPHYAQVDLYTGALRAFWIDSLSAFYQGLLAMAGYIDEAIETHLLYTALWTRYSAMPERWSTATGTIEHGLRWWGGRPEFIESTWYLYHTTKDPWYLHVGEMTLRDIKRRCWTKCGWAGLQDIRTGELSDRMESFFLGETAKYLFLLFDPSHPLNTWDAPYVFTTEGHPLIIPKRLRPAKPQRQRAPAPDWQPPPATCPLPPPILPLTISATAARPDVFHAASLARLHLMPTVDTLDSPLVEFTAAHPSISVADVRSPSNYTYYPWTLPLEYIPANATSSPLALRTTFDLSFPTTPNAQLGTMQRIPEGILVNSMSGLRLGMVREHDQLIDADEHFRIYAISNVALGRDEKVFMSRATIDSFNPLDPYFTRTRDTHSLDLVVDVAPELSAQHVANLTDIDFDAINFDDLDLDDLPDLQALSDPDSTSDSTSDPNLSPSPSYLSNLLSTLQSLLTPPTPAPEPTRHTLRATLPTGPGAAPLPDTPDADSSSSSSSSSSSTNPIPLPWTNIHIHPTPLCTDKLPLALAKNTQILVLPRGGCSFSHKLSNIPAYPPDPRSLQLVVVVSGVHADEKDEKEREDGSGGGDIRDDPLIQPLLDQPQRSPSGIPRRNPIPLILLGGGADTVALLRRARALGVRRRWYFKSQGVRIANLVVL